jgi:flagellar hook-associated protein 1 FlgK
MGRLSFYSTKAQTGIEIESLMGELQGSYNFQTVINNMWYAMQELTNHPQGIETRDYFLATCQSFVTKSNQVFDSLFEYQHNLDQQVRDMVRDINNLVTTIRKLNIQIYSIEVSGDNANDYRDERNRALDKLSELIPLEYYTDAKGHIGMLTNGVELLSNNNQSFFGLRYCTSSYSFVEPIIMHKPGQILSASTPPDEFRGWINYTKPVNADRNNDYGALMGLIISRGAGPVYHMGKEGIPPPVEPKRGDFTTQEQFSEAMRIYRAHEYNYRLQLWCADNCMIPKAMQKLDEIFNAMVRMINDALAPMIKAPGFNDPFSGNYGKYMQDPHAPFDNNGNQSFMEVFTRKHVGRWDNSVNPPVFIPEKPGDYSTFYSIGNIMINPGLLDTDGGYNFLSFSPSGDIEDSSLIKQMLETWQRNDGPYAVNIGGQYYSVQTAYVNFVTQIGLEVAEAKGYIQSQTILVEQADNNRQSVMGVAMDEEMSNMMKYQYAYQSAARILNVIDSMIDTVVNRTGRVGL